MSTKSKRAEIEKIVAEMFHEAKKRDIMLFGTFNLNDIKMEANAYQYIKKNNLLLNISSSQSWIQLSLLECIWLRIIETLRDFGCSTSVMKAIHLKLNFNDENEPSKAIVNINEQIKEIENNFTQDDEYKKALINEITLIRDDEKLINIFDKDITHLSNLASLALKGYHTGFIIYPDKTIELFSVDDYVELVEKFELTRSHIIINIWDIINQLLNNEKFVDPIARVSLSSDEIKLLDIYREKDIRKIEIYKGPNEKAPIKILTENFRENTKIKIVTELKKILPKYKNSTFKITLNDESNLTYVRMSKHIINKNDASHK